MSVVTPTILRKFRLPATFDDPRISRHYAVYARDGKLYETESKLNAAGEDVFRATHQVKWIVGSGENSIGGIVQRGHYLFEAPLAFYTKPRTWAWAPGYEFADLAFSRPILAGCIFCHNGRANPVPNTNGRYRDVPFPELAVGCENCHGPGSAHIKAVMSGRELDTDSLAIVNPQRLTPQLANDTCMACHEFGDVRILRTGKTYQDIRPGAPLDDVISILMVPPTGKTPPRSDQLHQYYSMSLSKCFRASGGRLRCITCHNPHVQLSAQEAPAIYNKRCFTCHTDQGCGLSRAARQRGTPPDNCIGCHMPKRKVTFIAHTNLTNHRILKRPDEPFPNAMFHQTTAALPDLIHLDPAPGKEDVLPSLLTLLQAYSELGSYNTKYVAPYFRTLDQLERTNPNNALVQAGLGSRDLKDGKLVESVSHLNRSLQIDPSQATVYGLLSNALERVGRTDEALSVQHKAVEQDPYNPVLQKQLIGLYVKRKQYVEARTAVEHYLKIFPQDDAIRHVLISLESSTTK